MMLNIEVKYNKGDIIRYIHKETKYEHVPCGFCDGAGRLKGCDGTVHECPVCEGYGWNEGKAYQEVNEWQDEIDGIQVHYDSDNYPYKNAGPSVRYRTKQGHYVDQNDVREKLN